MTRLGYLPLALLLACGSTVSPTNETGASGSAVSDADKSEPTPPPTTLQVIVEPSDDGAALIAAINGATKSVHMTMYELSAKTIISALTGRAAAGVDVEVILDSSGTTQSLNSKSYATLQAAGVKVVWSWSEFTYTHEKCVVIDGSVAWIMTMNSAASSLTANREYLAIDPYAADVAEAEGQFVADFAHVAYTPSGDLLTSPVTSRPGIEAVINNATNTIDFEVEEITDTTITADFCAAAQRGVKVRGCVAATSESSGEQTAVSALKSCGVSLVTVSVPYIHAKAIVADGATAFIGSENFSPTSLDKNRELGLTTQEAAFVSTVATTVAGDIGAGTAL